MAVNLSREDKALVDWIIRLFHAQCVIVEGVSYTCKPVDKSSNPIDKK